MDDTQPAVAEGKQAQNPELRGLERGRSHQNMLKYSGTAAIACVRVQEYAHASARGINIEDVNPEYLGQMSQRILFLARAGSSNVDRNEPQVMPHRVLDKDRFGLMWTS